MGDVPAEEGAAVLGPEGFGIVSCGPGSLRRGVTCGTTTGGGGGGGVCGNRSGAKGNPAKNTASAITSLRIAKPSLADTAQDPAFIGRRLALATQRYVLETGVINQGT